MSEAILSLCDFSGNAVRPWLEYGYECWIVDTQHPRGLTQRDGINCVGADIHELHPYHRWMPPGVVSMVMAWPECTHAAYSGQRWRRENGPRSTAHGFLLFAACWDLCRFYERERGASWMIENPDGIFCSWCKPDYSFDPFEYGDAYTKHTNLWTGGGFVMPRKNPVLLNPDTAGRIHRAAPGPDRANFRSETPMGFATAVRDANAENFARATA